jgi:hypothetical protein
MIVLGVVAVGLLFIGFIRSWTNFDAFWLQAERVLQSGIFYFFAGLALLLYAIHTTNAQEHPSLTFLIAMLGVAIMLFGTGSQAASTIATAGARLPAVSEARGIANTSDRSMAAANDNAATLLTDHAAVVAETNAKAIEKAISEVVAKPSDAEKATALANLVDLAKNSVSAAEKAKLAAVQYKASGHGNDWGPIKANAAIAGGAAVLAALFGWGVIHYSDDIRQVFGDYERYEKIVIDACASYDRFCKQADNIVGSNLERFNLNDYTIGVQRGDGVSLFAAQNAQRITLMVFATDLRESSFIRFIAKRPKSSSVSDFDDEIEVLIPMRNHMKRSDSASELMSGYDAPADSECLGYNGTTNSCKLARLKLPDEAKQRVKTVAYSLNFFRGADNAGQVRRVTRRPADIAPAPDTPHGDTNTKIELEPYAPRVHK